MLGLRPLILVASIMNKLFLKNRCKQKLFLGFCLFCLTINAQADWIKTSGDIGRYAVPVAAGLITLYKQDFTGTKQLALSYAGYLLLVEVVLKDTVKARRPDIDGQPSQSMRSFPSGHAASAFTGAVFLQRRYGWKYGVPAFLAASYVGYTRIHAHAHHFRDVFGSFVFASVVGVTFTRPYESKNIKVDIQPEVSPDSMGIKVAATLK